MMDRKHQSSKPGQDDANAGDVASGKLPVDLPADPALESLLDEALALNADDAPPADLAGRIVAATTPMLAGSQTSGGGGAGGGAGSNANAEFDVDAADVIGRVGPAASRWLPRMAVAAGLMLAAFVGWSFLDNATSPLEPTSDGGRQDVAIDDGGGTRVGERLVGDDMAAGVTGGVADGASSGTSRVASLDASDANHAARAVAGVAATRLMSDDAAFAIAEDGGEVDGDGLVDEIELLAFEITQLEAGQVGYDTDLAFGGGDVAGEVSDTGSWASTTWAAGDSLF